jgi:membrane protein DedA with SNARE-associated domain
MGFLADLRDSFGTQPVFTLLYLYSLVAAVVLLPATLLLAVQGVTPGNEVLWVAVVAVGVSISAVWTVAYPVYDQVV